MLNRLLDAFEGKLTSSKWATIEKCSPDTALRYITKLLDRGVLQKDEASGRSTTYSAGGGLSMSTPDAHSGPVWNIASVHARCEAHGRAVQ